MIPAPRHISRVQGWLDVPLYVPEWGNPDGAPVMLIHGWSQAHQCWAHQLNGALDDFRLIAPDLRGHGMSGKPEAAGHYDNSEPWATDIAHIIDTLKLDQPYLVGWSMGGWVVQDYLRHYGDAVMSGAALIGSAITAGKHLPDAARDERLSDAAVVAEDMLSADLTKNAPATIDFLRACMATEPDARTLAFMTAYNMACPAPIRKAARTRDEDYRKTTAACTKPLAVIWGQHERLAVPAIIEQTKATLPDATYLKYEHSGHAPFWEEPGRFNADLSRIITQARI